MGEARPVTVSCRSLWKVFGDRPERIIGSPDADLPRAELLEKTGCVAAVRDVSFDVSPGEVFVVMGLSGSGKSTLVRMLNRLHEPTAGQILVDGEDVLKMSDERLRELRRTKISMVFQHFGLLPTGSSSTTWPTASRSRGGQGRTAEGRQQVLDVVGLGAGATTTPTSCRAGCSSGSGWPGPWPPTPRSCCSTSRSARWTP